MFFKRLKKKKKKSLPCLPGRTPASSAAGPGSLMATEAGSALNCLPPHSRHSMQPPPLVSVSSSAKWEMETTSLVFLGSKAEQFKTCGLQQSWNACEH